MRIEFDSASHTYTLGGERVPSVTQVLDPLIELDGIPPDVLEAARVFGTHGHEALHLMVRGELDWYALHPALTPYLRGAQRFIKESGCVVIASEYRVHSQKLRCAGMLDLAVMLGGAEWIIDAKFTSVVPSTVGLQTAGYEQLYREMRGGRERKRACLWLKPDDYKLIPLTDSRDYSWFVSALNIYRFREIYGRRNKPAG